MSMIYAVVNKETKIVENIIMWDGIDTNLVPENQEWIIANVVDGTPIRIGLIYQDGEFHIPLDLQTP